MPLVLEIEHLLGVAFAARGPDSGAPDWPPQPDRVFSALVAAWAARGERPEERAALVWLEEQPTPEIAASPAADRPAPTSFVPPNDKLQVTANPAWRTRQPRRFPAALPQDPTVRLVWAEGATPHLGALDAVARDVAYVGHSASLTRCRFTEGEAPAGAVPARRRVYPGRLRELEAAFSKDAPKLRRRPSPGEPVRPPRPAPAESANAFSPDWLTFEIVGGAIDLRAAPLACKALIKAVMSGYGGADGARAPEWVCGHREDGSPSPDPHLAAVPLAYAGYEHADGALLGLALAPPRGRGDLLLDPDFARALLATSQEDADGRRIVHLTFGKAGCLDLALTLDAARASLNPVRYRGPSRRWATVTPLVLDRHLDPPDPRKNGDGDRYRAEAEALIKQACVNVGLPPPVRAVAVKHSSVNGAPGAYPSGAAPAWTGWRVPGRLASRRLTHALIDFGPDGDGKGEGGRDGNGRSGPVAGPVLIGAGRFCGLGLCLPLDREPGR